jgi:succinate dehydrogenase / fumarate reductase, membrane anchor subunit
MSRNLYGSRVQPSGGIELFAWYFMRVSAVVLLFMALFHYAVMHVFNTSASINYQFVASRFGTPIWRAYDLVMLFLAMLHGMNGLRYVIDDYIHPKGWKLIAQTLLYLMTLVIVIFGTTGILMFTPKM